jgi:hypothetical protein
VFGLDWVSIIAAAAGGGIGGALGMALASFSKSGVIRTMLIVAPIVLGGRLGPLLIQPELEKTIGPQVRTAQFDAAYSSEIRPGIVKHAALDRIFKEDPATEAAFKAELRKAYQDGGAKGAMEAAAGIGARVLGNVFVRYMPRARTEDIFGYTKTMSSILHDLTDKDPEACVLMLYGAQHRQAIPTSRLRAAVGEKGMKAMLDINNQVVANAVAEPIAFDAVRGETLTAELAQRHADILTGEAADVASGTRMHKTREEAQAACAFSAALFADIVALPPEDAEATLRYMFQAS